ncbi:DUF4166 domain-containing protein [Bacillus horti]|uniref:DUF4166 domain-containing protein n=1 Tax=Caldalkalibacillus horti TaxID=77523 RepID=A0ABT9W3N7_9BACI|nr:DUF4166 domain-containing protein [Bacillus horti]MDQ0167460.1 hypothetical protein [Bacillus horti]
MRSIYEQALGNRFNGLHPLLQKKFRLQSQTERILKSKGVMHRIEGGKVFMKPLMSAFSKKHITFPERGRNIPFTMENVAFKDPYGRESVAWIRRFYFPHITRCFDATMVLHSDKKTINDYVGVDQSWLTNITLEVTECGGLRMLTKEQRIFIPFLNRFMSIPFLGKGVIEERYDDQKDLFLIDVHVQQPWFGTIIRYQGEFTVESESISSSNIPSYMLPRRFHREE